jgi:hypothetical protein
VVKRAVINMDNGPDDNRRCSQLLPRMVRFTDVTGLVIRRACFPPDYSKYNAIERCWTGLEKSWTGYLLNSMTTVLNRSASSFWKGFIATMRPLSP